MSCYHFILLGLLTGPVLVWASLTCTPEYEARGDSSLCITDNPAVDNAQSGVSAADIQTILDVHNNFRDGVNPTSSNMQKAAWDDKLASLAQKWAQQCIVGHDTSSARHIIEYARAGGQNAAGGQGDWTSAITAWHNEVKDFTYGTGSTAGGVVGHYTQVVQAGVAKIGCGYAYCDTGYKRYYICEYILGNVNVPEPYADGASCADCSATCSGNLCDCGGKFCFNGGTLDLNTCTCQCPELFTGDQCLEKVCGGKECFNDGTLDVSTCTCQCFGYTFSGDQCTDKLCPPTDIKDCSTVTTASCTQWKGTRRDCPFTCGICELSEATPCDEHPFCHDSTHGCRYFGVYHTPEQCATYGAAGEDTWACESTGGTWAGCDFCAMYSNVPTQYCPKMCAICPE